MNNYPETSLQIELLNYLESPKSYTPQKILIYKQSTDSNVISDGINSLQITRFTQEFEKIPERTWILLTSYNFSINRPKQKISIGRRNPIDPNLIDISFSEFQTKNIDPDMPIPDDSDCVNLTDLLNIRTL
jgi:hypothetical protein